MVGIIVAINCKGIYAHNEIETEEPNIPWHLKSDFLNFKKVTLGNGNNVILMGTKTRESIPRNLPGRKNVVVSSQGREFSKNETFTSLREALIVLSHRHVDLWILGGRRLWLEALGYADLISLTLIRKPILPNKSTLFCPELIPGSKALKNFQIIDKETQFFEADLTRGDEANFSIFTLKRVKEKILV